MADQHLGQCSFAYTGISYDQNVVALVQQIERLLQVIVDDERAELMSRLFDLCFCEREHPRMQDPFENGSSRDPELEMGSLDLGKLPQQSIELIRSVDIASGSAPRGQCSNELVLVGRRKRDCRH